VLTNVVLNVLTLHYMQAFLLPDWVLKAIQKSIRRYLWRGAASLFSGGHCLLSRQIVMLPKRNGGLDITNLQLQNQSLILKWAWVAATAIDSLWTSTFNDIGLACFKDFHKMVQTQHGAVVKVLRYDNGIEYTNRAFGKYSSS
jgi:hypothetical protein